MNFHLADYQVDEQAILNLSSSQTSVYGTYTYVYVPVSLRPAGCASMTIQLTPSVAGDYSLYALADSANILRETNEADNGETVVLTAY